MSVNTMEFKQAATLLNNLRQQVTGQTTIAPADTSEFVSVGQTLFHTLKIGSEHFHFDSGNSPL